MFRAGVRALGVTALATLATAVVAQDDFPLAGTYTENQPCIGADASVSRVRITLQEIDSVFGLCKILDRKRHGDTFAIHVECNGPGGSQMLGDVTFKIRTDKTVDFADQDETYKAVLHRCPD